MKLQKLGGYVAIAWVCWVPATTIIVQLILSHLGLSLSDMESADPSKLITAYGISPTTFIVTQSIIMLEGIFALLIILALHERMAHKAPYLMHLALIAVSIFAALHFIGGISYISSSAGIAESKDISTYRAIAAMRSGFSAAGYHIWGWALLLSGWAALKTRSLPRISTYLILLYGIFAIFGYIAEQISLLRFVLFIPSMIWLGIVLIRKEKSSQS